MLIVGMAGFSQYNPSLHVPLNKALGIAQDAPTDARSMYYDAVNFKYRAYQSTAEVLSYLNLSKYRTGQFDIIINSGGVLSSGVITGGTNTVWYFKNGTANGDLVRKSDAYSVNGQSGAVVIGNADSLLDKPIDTGAVMRNNYVLTYDSTNQNWELSASGVGGGGTTYTQGSGIVISGSEISVNGATALYNAIQLRGRAISTTAPTTNQVIKWNGTEYAPAEDAASLDTAYYSNDTLFLVASGDTSRVHLQLVPVTDNWGTQTAHVSYPLSGLALEDDAIELDTSTATGVATKSEIALLDVRVDDLEGAAGVTVENAAGGTGQALTSQAGSVVTVKKIKAGTNVTLSADADEITVNASSGSAEINTIPETFTATDSTDEISAGTMVSYILVKPTSNLTAFKVGSQSDDDLYVTSTPVQADADFQILIAPIYIGTAAKLYFSGITSSTQIKIITKPLHE